MRRFPLQHPRWPFAIALACIGLFPGIAFATADTRESFDLQVPLPPTPVTVDGSVRLVYEVHLTNFARDALSVERIEVLDAGRGAVLADYRDDALRSRLFKPGAAGDKSTAIAPGMRGVVYVELDLGNAPVPESLQHRVGYAPGAAGAATATTRGAPTPVRDGPAPPVFGPPLRGGPWAAVYSPSLERGHRQVLYTVDGRARIPGRFAIDWFKLDDAGRSAPEGEDRPERAYGYGAEVLAVADAVVVDLRDGVPEKSAAAPRKPRALLDGAGNYVVLGLDDGRYVFYEHLAPGSIRVRQGERVRRGQPVAALGSTGDSSVAHLHMHLADEASLLGGEGLPFMLERYRLLGRYADIDDLERPWIPHDASAPAERRREMPGPNVVVEFEDG